MYGVDIGEERESPGETGSGCQRNSEMEEDYNTVRSGARQRRNKRNNIAQNSAGITDHTIQLASRHTARQAVDKLPQVACVDALRNGLRRIICDITTLINSSANGTRGVVYGMLLTAGFGIRNSIFEMIASVAYPRSKMIKRRPTQYCPNHLVYIFTNRCFFRSFHSSPNFRRLGLKNFFSI